MTNAPKNKPKVGAGAHKLDNAPEKHLISACQGTPTPWKPPQKPVLGNTITYQHSGKNTISACWGTPTSQHWNLGGPKGPFCYSPLHELKKAIVLAGIKGDVKLVELLVPSVSMHGREVT